MRSPSERITPSLWDILGGHPLIGAALIGMDGTIHSANRQISRLHYGREIDLAGRSFFEFESSVVLQDALPILRTALETHVPASLVHIRGARQLLTKLWAREGDRVVVVSTHHAMPIDIQTVSPVYELRHVDWGPLDVLSGRELEVLALISEGQPLKKTAPMLGLSIKTVEKHRTSIGRKLNVHTSAELARIALSAGLSIRTARKPRVRFWQMHDPCV